MREIKFRAWDLVSNEMTSWDVMRDIRVSLYYLNPQAGTHFIMQYTGLKDKNGKEIYEGDIVICASRSACPHEVIWIQETPSTNLGGMPGFYLSGLNEGYVWMGREELIGNIYENPELLSIK